MAKRKKYRFKVWIGGQWARVTAPTRGAAVHRARRALGVQTQPDGLGGWKDVHIEYLGES